MVKAGSPTESMSKIAFAASTALFALDTLVWYQHVMSKDNPADVLSREALEDREVQANLASGVWQFREPVTPPQPSLRVD